MSEFLAEAQVLITPDTTKFRALLAAELATATRGLPPIAVPVAPIAVNAAQIQSFATTTNAAAAATQTLGLESARTTKALADQSNAARHATQRLAQAQQGLLATTATMSGLRGAAIGASGPFLAAAVAVTAFGKAIQSAASLETNLNVFRVTAKATGEEMERVADTSRQLGADLTLPGVSAGDAAVAMTELAKAGLSVQDSLDGARGALQLATAAQIDNATATNLIATALNSFRLNGAEAVRVADLLTGAANESQGSITDMGLALQQAAAVASLVGISVEDTVTILTQLTQAGLKGSDAGTSFRTALIRLVNPTEKVKETLAKLNVQLRDTEGNIRPEFFGELGVALGRLSPAARQATTAILGGSDAVRAFGLLSRDGARAFEETRDAITEGGLAAELAGARTQGFAGKVENLKNQAETLGTSLGQVAIGPLGLFVGALADAASDLNTVVGGLQDMQRELGKISAPLREQIPLIEKVEGGFGDLAKTAVKLQLLGPTITIAAFAMKKFGDETEDAARKASVFDGIASSITGTLGGLSDALTRAAAPPPGQDQALLPSLATQLAIAEAGGDEQQILSLLRKREANQARFLERLLGRPQDAKTQALVREAAANLGQTRNDIQAILDGQASDAKQQASSAKAAAAAIATARNEADQAILNSLGLRESRRQNRVLVAASTEGLRDDIRTNIALRAFYRRSIEEVKKTVRDTQTRAQAVASLTRDLIAADRAVKDAKAAQLQAAQEAAQERRDERQRALELNLEFAITTENTAAQARALRALISDLDKQIANTKKGTNKYRELRNARAARRKELEDLVEEEKETNTFAQTAFEFLQKQQGFAANLLGNLFPDDSISGTVGGTTPPPRSPDAGLASLAAVKASRDQGVTPGQFHQLLGIQSRMLDVLERIASHGGHPEARYQRSKMAVSMDFVD